MPLTKDFAYRVCDTLKIQNEDLKFKLLTTSKQKILMSFFFKYRNLKELKCIGEKVEKKVKLRLS